MAKVIYHVYFVGRSSEALTFKAVESAIHWFSKYCQDVGDSVVAGSTRDLILNSSGTVKSKKGNVILKAKKK